MRIVPKFKPSKSRGPSQPPRDFSLHNISYGSIVSRAVIGIGLELTALLLLRYTAT